VQTNEGVEMLKLATYLWISANT